MAMAVPSGGGGRDGGSREEASGDARVYHSIFSPRNFPNTTFKVSAFSHIGGRKSQEDRFTVAPQLVENEKDCALVGVFDGTVGDFASENVKDLVVPTLLASPKWKAFVDRLERLQGDRPAEEDLDNLKGAIVEMYKESDEQLLHLCAQEQKHYAACTSVTALIVGGLIAVGHLGDSRIVVGVDPESSENSGDRSVPVIGEFVTNDHKPDLPAERERIEQSGGSVEYLHNHNNKPFIRGGDFTMRKSLGESPMQLQYSRAFGGKDLKMFGLSNTPDVNVIPIKPATRWVILASDGLWDVCNAQQAALVAHQARQMGRSPAEALVRAALQEQDRRNTSSDNVTAVCVYLHDQS